jgi:hypothetical protein
MSSPGLKLVLGLSDKSQVSTPSLSVISAAYPLGRDNIPTNRMTNKIEKSFLLKYIIRVGNA